MNLLGVDLSTHLGWAFQKENIYRCGVEHFPSNPEQSDVFRLAKIRKFFRELLDRAEPTHMVRERMFIPNSNSHGGKLLIKIEGIIDLECNARDIPCDVIAPTSLKKEFTGSGKASKELMVRYANAWWLERNPTAKPFLDDNIGDAVACLAYAKEMLE